MTDSKNTNNIFTRFDITAEEEEHAARIISSDSILQKVGECIIEGNEELIEQVVREALKTKSPLEVTNAGLIAGMKEVSRLWAEGSYFLPQVILSSDAMVAGIAVCEQKFGKPMEKKAKVITHTAEGDIHDIGQVIVNALLNANGFEVINLGCDVPVDEVVNACISHKPVLVTGTALMTTTMSAFPRIAEKLIKSDLEIPFVCGGGAVTEEYVNSFDLGIWGKEASQAPGMADDALKGLSWIELRKKWNG